MKNISAQLTKLEKLPKANLYFLYFVFFCIFFLVGIGLGSLITQYRIKEINKQQSTKVKITPSITTELRK